jgi:RNA polymerase sigma factor (sigma-70 family)
MTHDEKAAVVARFDPWTKKVADDLTRSVDNDGFEDLVNEGRIAIWRSLDRFDPEQGALASWVTTAARQRMRNLRFGKARECGHIPLRGSREVEIAFHIEAGASEDESEDPIFRRTAVQPVDTPLQVSVRQAVRRLPKPRDREIVYYRFWEDLTWDQVAEKLGVSRPLVTSRWDDYIKPALAKALTEGNEA